VAGVFNSGPLFFPDADIVDVNLRLQTIPNRRGDHDVAGGPFGDERLKVKGQRLKELGFRPTAYTCELIRIHKVAYERCRWPEQRPV
jgi:hypothetical protein